MSEVAIPNIVMDDREVREEFDTAKVEKPEEVEEPPPELPEPEFESPDIDNAISIAPDVGVKVDIGDITGFTGAADCGSRRA